MLDVTAEEYGPVFQAKNDAVAMRNVLRMVKENRLDLNDFLLYRFGSFDSDKGVLQGFAPTVVPYGSEDKD
jgi:hypothetical protein